MLEALKEKVYKANMDLVHNGLVLYTWGNVSGIDVDSKLVVIKPSGVPYDELKPEDMVVVNLDGKTVEGSLRPSSDTKTHIELYKSFPQIRGVAHTHSTFATIFAQAGCSIPILGTTHADYFNGNIPCSRSLTQNEVNEDYEKNTGKVICETFVDTNYLDIPGVLVYQHGPFTWGDSPDSAVFNSTVLEKISELAFQTLQLSRGMPPKFPDFLLERHYCRKHGDNAYYGQDVEKIRK